VSRRRARTDRNHTAIVDALRKAGAQVQSLAAIGGGVPDLLVAKHGKVLLVEVKDGRQPPSKRQLTADEALWHATWGAHLPVVVVESAEQALEAMR
jgi:Holliday junction resolvase